MVIERALEKLKQSQAAKAARSYSPPVSQAPVRKREGSGRNESAMRPGPTFPRLTCDAAVTDANRILLPGTRMADNARISAAYRMVRTRLLHQIRSNNWASLAITSPEAAEGKTLTTINLALNLVRDRANSVFLVDLDMRNPSVCRYLGVQPPQEITSFFAGHCPAESVFFSIGIENLAIAGGTTTTDLASELVATGRLEELIDYCRSIASNPLVLIDLPPLLATDEALLIAPRVDATLLVVSEGRTRRDSLARARQLLADFTCAGAILNRSTEILGQSGYYYAYGDNSTSKR